MGFQEKLMLQNKAKEAMEKGEKPPNEPGMQQALKEMDEGNTVDGKPVDGNSVDGKAAGKAV